MPPTVPHATPVPTRATAHFAWQGFRLSLPQRWNPVRLEGTYDLRLTNRLILQWLAEATLYGKDDAQRNIGSGLSTVEAGLRLRYEFTRRFAPYIGVAWERAYGNTADLRREEGDDIDDTRFAAGLRFWF